MPHRIGQGEAYHRARGNSTTAEVEELGGDPSMFRGAAMKIYPHSFDKQIYLPLAGDEAPLSAKAAAVSAIVLWVGVLYFGSMLPFIGNAF